LALIGAGSFGVYLGDFVRNCLDDAAIVAVVEPDSDRRCAAVVRFAIPGYASLEELLDVAGDSFEAALVVSPNHLHRDQTIALARAGKHIFCEKPMALRGTDCQQMVRTTQEHNVRLMVGHKRRFRPAWQRLIELVGEDEIGDVRAVNINGWHHHPDIPTWWLRTEEGGGLLHRAGVHDIDICNALLGNPVWVCAAAAPPVRPDAVFAETLWATVGYESGAIAGLQVSLWFSPVHFRDSFSVQVIGTHGSAILRNAMDGGQTLTWGSDAAALHTEVHADGYEVAYYAELSSFVGWVSRHEEPLLTWREGWQAVRVMEAAYDSARAGSRVPLDPLPPS